AEAGFRIDGSEAGLYLWVSRDEDCWVTLSWLAERGIVAAPGAFYGPAGARHVRMALTVSDSAAEQAARRLVNRRQTDDNAGRSPAWQEASGHRSRTLGAPWTARPGNSLWSAPPSATTASPSRRCFATRGS